MQQIGTAGNRTAAFPRPESPAASFPRLDSGRNRHGPVLPVFRSSSIVGVALVFQSHALRPASAPLAVRPQPREREQRGAGHAAYHDSSNGARGKLRAAGRLAADGPARAKTRDASLTRRTDRPDGAGSVDTDDRRAVGVVAIGQAADCGPVSAGRRRQQRRVRRIGLPAVGIIAGLPRYKPLLSTLSHCDKGWGSTLQWRASQVTPSPDDLLCGGGRVQLT
ncbi:hypothetical protein DFJ74DRAFT_657865 [Hyaloraphidium curvatum]|nr:hypothetical protein DFJ74DRAFT_657865 [Hyaloraphidium curvatum]